MSRVIKAAALSSSSAPKAEQQDQRKIYMDWANHYLRKAHYTDTLSDLHDCVQGDYLPKIIHAIVQSTVPGITVAPATEEERSRNIKCCIRHLESSGVSCSSFSVAELTEGNMKALLSLFYSLSQYKRTNKSVSTELPVSRIARPVSPGFKSSHGVSSGTPPLTTSNGIAGGAGMGGASKSISPSANRRTAGSSIMTSTVDKAYPARQIVPHKNAILNGENPTALERDAEGAREEEREGGVSTAISSKLQGSLSAGGSTSRLDQMTTKSGIPGVKASSPMDGSSRVSFSQPNLNRIPCRSKSDPRLGQRTQRKESTSSLDPGSDTPAKASSVPKRMLKQPSSGSVMGRASPVDTATSGHATPSKVTRPSSRLNKSSTSSEIRGAATREASSDDSESEHLKFERKRSNSEVRRPSGLCMPRSASRTGGEVRGGIPSPSGRGLVKGLDSRLPSPGLVPPGDRIRPSSPSLEKERSAATSDPGTTARGDANKRLTNGGLQTPTQHKLQPHASPTFARKTASVSEESKPNVAMSSAEKNATSRGDGELTERPSSATTSKLSKPPSSLPRLAAGRKSPSGLSKIHTPSSSLGLVPPSVRGSKIVGPRGVGGGKRERERVSSSSSSLEGSVNSESEVVGPVKPEKPLSQTGSSPPSENPKPLSEGRDLVATLPGGKDSRRISPEGMSPDAKFLSNESISASDNQKNGIDRPEKQVTEAKLRTIGSSDGRGGVRAEKVGGVIEVGRASESETQTPNLSQGSEVTMDSTLSSLSLASTSSPHSSLPHSSLPHTSTGTASPDKKQTVATEGASSHKSRHFNPQPRVKSPLAKEKDKAKRARSLSPKYSRRIFPLPPQQDGPTVNVSHYDASAGEAVFSPPPSSSERFAHLELSRTDSPESVKSDVAVPAYSSLRKPLRSSLRTAREKDSSSSSVDSGKCHLATNKVTISPRSSQVVYLPDEAGLQLSATLSQPTILSPGKRLMRGRPSSLSDNCSIEQDPEKRGSIFSEKMDYSDEEKFLSLKLSRSVSHQQYDSTPELLQTFENELSTMKKDLANKDRMLSMYENSMADLSSKVHHLKKTLEEKDQEIKHLTEVKLFDLEGRSLASRMSTMGTDVLSDGCLSDSAMEPSRHRHKGDEKKKKKWKRWSFRKKAKDIHDLATQDTVSVISGKSGRSLSANKRNPSKSKSDLMSISEYSPDMRMRDIDAKSYTSEFPSSLPGPMPYSDDIITVYDDPTPGAKAPVTLLPGYSSYHLWVEGRGREGDGEEGEGTVVLGTVSIAPEISWITMDTKICDIFMHHINSLDEEGKLGLSEDSILHYFIADQRREIGNALLPSLTPYQSLATGTTVKIVLKGTMQGSCDSLAYKVLINTETLHSYISLLMATQWLVVMGTKGTCKTSLAMGLSRHLMQLVCEEEEEERGEVVMINYNVEKDGIEEVILDMKEDLSRKIRMWPHPPIITIDNIYECSVMEQILTTAENLPRRPYIIATLCTATMQGVPLHQLLFHHQMRVVTCNPQTEPVFGILSRSLRKQIYKLKAARIQVDPVAERLVQWLPYLLEQLDSVINRFHTQTVSLGPRVFMDCAVDQNADELETWFINLWNHFVVPYLMGAVMAGIETYTADPQLEWVDVRELVVEMYPWQPAINVVKLRTLNPEDVGWNHAIRPQRNRFMFFKDDMKLPDDTRSFISRIKPE